MTYPNPADLEAIRKDPNVQVLEQPGLNVGYLAYSGNMDMALALRTVAVRDGTVIMQAGGGIAHDHEEREHARDDDAGARGLAQVDPVGIPEMAAEAPHLRIVPT